MSTLELKTTLHSLIENIDDDHLLEAYLVLLSREAKPEADFWEKLDTGTKTAIQEGLQDLKEGRKTDFFQFMKQQYGVER